MNSRLKRIATDSGGYLLILLGIVLSPLPGPGGIPLILGGLGLLSIDNAWARRLRVWMVKHSGSLARIIFPKHHVVQDLYDLAAVLMIGVVAYLTYVHAAIWQLSLAAFLFCMAMLIVGMNRDRVGSLQRHIKGEKPRRS